jgi:hypothetical protein
MLVEADVTVDRPLEPVFDALADLRHLVVWPPGAAGGELLTGEPVGQDGRFALLVDGERCDAVLRRHQRPHVLEISATGRPTTWRCTLALREGAAGTVVIGRFERNPRGLRRLLAPFLMRALRTDAAERLRAAKAYCEA